LLKWIYPFGANIYQKFPILAILVAVTHIFKTTVVKFGVRVQTWETLFQAKFCIKKSLKGVYPFGANLYQKLPNSAILGAASPHFKSDNGDIWREGTDLGHPPPPLIL